ncbi:MAG: CoA pyrophosphatase [Candidatus Cloacimonetes bacterium]|nr:CoA pyrophosphatase [Candidatus Cloacimonadota bacterium]MCF7815183.1 CoA pyrophosphatase [Candidatus Cloacimonadota bacterium]MCF7867863.1 CoA pyrophosphatase [Candidatus Cloacimonadota bacterium]
MKNELNEIVKDLPSKPEIMGSRNLQISAVLVPFIRINDEYQLLFEKRADHIRQGSEISFPGGGFEAEYDTNFQDTAIRETCEELGIEPENIRVYKPFETVVVPHGKIIYSFKGEIDSAVLDSMKPNHEVQYAFTVPLKCFLENEPEIYQARSQIFSFKIDSYGNEKILFPAEELGIPNKYQKAWGKRLYPIYVYRVQNEVIWGITGQIIFELMQKLRKAI